MTRVLRPGLYGVLDVDVTTASFTRGVASDFAWAGAPTLELRLGVLSDSAACELVRDIRSLMPSATLLVARRVDIAAVTAADGVVLGRDDLPVTHARRLLGDSALVGTWTEADADFHLTLPADFTPELVGIAPVVVVGDMPTDRARTLLAEGAWAVGSMRVLHGHVRDNLRELLEALS